MKGGAGQRGIGGVHAVRMVHVMFVNDAWTVQVSE